MGLLAGWGDGEMGRWGEKTTPQSIAGVAYGSYARVLLSPIFEQLENQEVSSTGVKASVSLEDKPELLWQAVELAYSLVSQIKSQSQ
jgi:hypothetical protein